MSKKPTKAVVIGASAGGVEALFAILPMLPADYPLPVFIVLHVPADKESLLPSLFGARCKLRVVEAEDKDSAAPATVYFAPPNYHLLLEKNGDLSLSNEDPLLYSRPSIDVLFESAADAYGDGLIGVVLTGGNNDGSTGLAAIAAAGGTCIVQDPAEAAVTVMPLAAQEAVPSAEALKLSDIATFLQKAGEKS